VKKYSEKGGIGMMLLRKYLNELPCNHFPSISMMRKLCDLKWLRRILMFFLVESSSVK
jgi:hypothetical protein